MIANLKIESKRSWKRNAKDHHQKKLLDKVDGLRKKVKQKQKQMKWVKKHSRTGFKKKLKGWFKSIYLIQVTDFSPTKIMILVTHLNHHWFNLLPW